MKHNLFLISAVVISLKLNSQCMSDTNSVYTFTINETPYALVKENKTWVDAAACAVASGGILAEINSQAEQDSVFFHLNLAGILAANTIAPDGGGGSYVWLGGNDITTEGKWVWDGDNSGSSSQFWQGTSTGSAVAGAYSNWGDEPDNWNGQDGLGLAVTNWPLGLAGQWNDVKETNALYYIIEYPKLITTSLKQLKNAAFSVYPNPVVDFILLKISFSSYTEYTLHDVMGRIVKKGTISAAETRINMSELTSGIYLLQIDNATIRLVKTE